MFWMWVKQNVLIIGYIETELWHWVVGRLKREVIIEQQPPL